LPPPPWQAASSKAKRRIRDIFWKSEKLLTKHLADMVHLSYFVWLSPLLGHFRQAVEIPSRLYRGHQPIAPVRRGMTPRYPQPWPPTIPWKRRKSPAEILTSRSNVPTSRFMVNLLVFVSVLRPV
jgi:hypothetical protein